jgi:16S rRNA (guanine527-N7)-methyltransferase
MSNLPADTVSLETIASTLGPFRKGLPEPQLVAIQEYLSLLLSWNRAINLTAIENPAEILTRHFGESLFAASILKLEKSRLADVGTGPGFPGLPLRIVVPDLELTLIESNLKKCAFLVETCQRLKFSNVEIMKKRFEEVVNLKQGFDFICSRALGEFPIFLPWALQALKSGGSIVLWLGTEESVRLVRRKEFTWQPAIPIPESRRRVILIGRKPK